MRLLYGSLPVSQYANYSSSTVSLKVRSCYVSIVTLLVTIVLASLSLEPVVLPLPRLSLLQNQFVQMQKRTCWDYGWNCVHLHIALDLEMKLSNRALTWHVQSPGFNPHLCSTEQARADVLIVLTL